MPQVILKGVTPERCEKLSAPIADRLAELINVPVEHIVVEHNDCLFFRGGMKDDGLCMVMVQWKTRPREMQKAVAEKLSEIIMGEGTDTVEVLYTNLNMNDFYEFKQGE